MGRAVVYVLGDQRIMSRSAGALEMPAVFWTIVGCLLASRRRRLSRMSIAAKLWPDQDTEAARHCLASALWRIRARMRPLNCLLVANDETLALDAVPGLWIDALAFERRAEAAVARPALLEDGCQRARLARALRHYAGDLLSEIDQEDIAIERARLRALYLDSMYALSRAQSAAADWNGAMRTARELCAAEPLREDAQRLLIEAYARCGNRGLALRQFRVCQAALARELDVEPMAATWALRARVLDASDLQAANPIGRQRGYRAALILARRNLVRAVQTIDRGLAAD